MILPQLHQLAIDERLVDELDYTWRTVSWIVHLNKDGSLDGICDNRVDIEPEPEKRKMVPRLAHCPTQFYRSGTDAQAHFLVDNPWYVFGVNRSKTKKIKPVRLAALREQFRQLVSECVVDTQDPAARAVLAFMDLHAPPNTPILPDEMGGEDMVAFMVDESLVQASPTVRTWWKHRQAKADQGDGDYQCMITGESIRTIGLFPKTSGLPGKDVKVVSCREPAYMSHGWHRNENTPFSRAAGIQVGAALNRLLSSRPVDGRGLPLPRRSIKIPGDMVLCYWAHAPNRYEEAILDHLWELLYGVNTQDSAKPLLQQIWDGEVPATEEPAITYLLTLAGGQGRATIRSWDETTMDKLVRNLARHYADMRICRRVQRDSEPAIPYDRVIESLIVCESKKGATKNRKIPVNMENALLNAIFHGGRYPSSIQTYAVRRMRVDVVKVSKEDTVPWDRLARMDARMALLKACMNRRRRFDAHAAKKYPEIGPDMNPTFDNTGYILGAVMALLERIQQAAAGRRINTSVIQRYGGASTTPRYAFSKMLREKMHHITKLQKTKSNERKLDRIIGHRCDRLLTSLLYRVGVGNGGGVPTRLDLDGQSLFALGYHQMRYWLYMSRDARKAWEAEHIVADPAFHWLAKSDDDVIAEVDAAADAEAELTTA
jgi:CRISPR-associated protein Csd1